MPFVVIAAPRTGSSNLMGLLSGHPEIFTNGNIFDDRGLLYLFWPKDELARQEENLKQLRRSDPDAFLRLVLAAGFGKPHVGFKIFEGENDVILQTLIQDPVVKKIVLLRRNSLASFSSSLVAKKTGRYGVLEEKPKPHIAKAVFDRRRFMKYHSSHFEFYRKVLAQLIEYNQEFHICYYEDLNEPLLLAALIRFVGADPRKAINKSEQYKRQVKLNPANILSRFANSAKVEKFLSQRNLLHWMHEGETSLLDVPRLEAFNPPEKSATGKILPS